MNMSKDKTPKHFRRKSREYEAGHGTKFFEKEQEVREGISLSEAGALEFPFSEAEIYAALMGMNGDKAPVLANRLKKVIGKVISPDQNAFIKGKQILDGFLIANEVMQKMTFGSKWIGWMWSCISTVKYSVLVNGVPAGFFSRPLKGGSSMAVGYGKGGTAAHCLLGAALGAPNRASSVWDGVEEKMRRRLALWKRQFLSKGGRITLIKSTLASIPLYQMSLFRMPKSVARRLEKLQRNFLWGGANGGNKAHLVKWEVVCADKEKGGLGLRKLVWLNKALLGKWIWRFARTKEELWKKVLEAKYGQEELGWRTRKAMGCLELEFGRKS
ncbi:putative ribonuclease H protein [Vitis vinifera]|uniref:Putative ribonuclease H protein n=1 Tax=Vitis vinifera TaxID=29760 RepID=A0A438FKR9_VITVI|nr:putative ribonuclease H protein [Vitis vinifera]